MVLSGIMLATASATGMECQPGEECIKVTGQRITCEDGAICSDGRPRMLTVQCWRDLTALRMARMSNTHRQLLDRGSDGGIDIAVPTGTEVYAAKDGIVVDTKDGLPEGDRTTTRGNFVKINYDDGSLGRYLHLLTVVVEPGYHVSAGDLIGTSNATGSTVRGVHLHYDLHKDRNRREPEDPAIAHGSC